MTADTLQILPHAPPPGALARAPFAVLQEGSVLALARMQGEGWHYIRA